MGSIFRSTPEQPRKCASRRRLYPPAEFRLAKERARRRPFHRRGHDRRAESQRYAFHHRGYSVWSTLPAVRQTIGLPARPNSFPRAQTWCFRCTTYSWPRRAVDQTSVGLVFAKQPPTQRVLTLQLTNDHFVIPPACPRLSRGGPRLAAQRRSAAQFFPAHASSRQTFRIQHSRTWPRAGDASPRQLRFLLAAELSPGPAPSARRRHRPPGSRVVSTIPKTIPTIPILMPRCAGAIKPTTK